VKNCTAIVINNNQCLKCDAINKTMVKVGAMVFCHECFEVEFVETGCCPVCNDYVYDPKSEVYQSWLEAYKKYIENWMKEED